MQTFSYTYYAADNDGRPWNWGRFYWTVSLPEGDECTFFANTVHIRDGVLIGMGHHHRSTTTDPDGEVRADWDVQCVITCGSDIPVVMLAPGAWLAFGAASMVSGNILALDQINFAHPEEESTRRQPVAGKIDAIKNCYLCQEPLSGVTEMDHVLPRSRGGKDSLVMPVHYACNRAKGNRPLIQRPK